MSAVKNIHAREINRKNVGDTDL